MNNNNDPAIRNTIKIFIKKLLKYELWAIALSFLSTFLIMVGLALAGYNLETFDRNIIVDWSTLIAYLGAFLIVFIRRDKKQIVTEIQHNHNKMTFSVFMKILAVFMMVAVAGSLVAEGIEALLNLFGYTMSEGVLDMVSTAATTLPLFIYANFMAPVIEEIIFRGEFLGSLKQYGKLFAIIISSLLFGVMHGNFMQIPNAFLVGLVLAYIAMEYSLKWAILIHIINNFVMVDILSTLIGFAPESMQVLLDRGVSLLMFGAGAVVVFIYRRQTKEYLLTNKTEKGHYHSAITTGLLLIYVAVYLAMSFMFITKS